MYAGGMTLVSGAGTAADSLNAEEERLVVDDEDTAVDKRVADDPVTAAERVMISA